MIRKYWFLLSTALIYLFAACSSKQGTAPDSTATPPPTPQGPALLMEVVKASSAHPDHPVEHLLDRDPTSYWSTSPGIGLNEGIQLNCAPDQNTFISQIKLTAVSGPGFAEVTEVWIYIDGLPYTKADPRLPIQIDTVVQTIFLRFAQMKELPHASLEREDFSVEILAFPSTQTIAFSLLECYNNTAQPLQIISPQKLPSKIQPTSNLNPVSRYHGGHLFDGRTESPWQEGAEGVGLQDSIHFILEKPLNITAIKIWNGDQSSPDNYMASARIKQFGFGEPGKTGFTYFLADRAEGFKVPLKYPVHASHFVLTIKDNYLGNSYSDLAISELLFYEGDQAIQLESDLNQLFKEEYLYQVRNGPLENLLNRSITNKIIYKDGSLIREQSLQLYDNGYFNCYFLEYTPMQDLYFESFANGHWQILENQAERTRIKLTGQYITYPNSLLEIREEQRYTQALNEELRIEQNEITGSSLLGNFFLP